MKELTGEEGGTEVRECRGPMVETNGSGGGLQRRCSSFGRGGGGALGTVVWKWEEIGEEEEVTAPIPYLWGAPERFQSFPPTISQIVGGIKFVPSGTWRQPKRPIRPHRGPHGPNGWTSDRVRLPAREPEQRCAKSRNT